MEIQAIYDEHKGNYGYRRITFELRNRGFVVNQKKVQRLMKLLGSSSQIRRKRKYSSYQGEVGKKADNLSDQADHKETERLLAELASRGYAVPDTTDPESKGLTVQMPADFFTEHTLGNLRQICENKVALFQAAFQTDCLDIIPSDEKVEFPWFTVEQDGDADAYCTFISMLCEFAKNQSRINRKPDTSDNPKYTMRCFLIRLGMVGAEFKVARKVILRNLTGNSAFRKVGDTDAVSE